MKIDHPFLFGLAIAAIAVLANRFGLLAGVR